MKQRTAFRVGWSVPRSLFVLTLALLVADLVLTLGGGLSWGSVPFFLVTVGFAGVGALVAARTSNRVGWLFLAEGLAVAITIAAKDYAARTGTASLPGAPWAGWIFTIALAAIWLPLLLALLLFPDGRLPSARWRPVAWAAVASGAVGVASVAVADVNFSSNFPRLTDPVTIVRAAWLRGIYNGGVQAAPIFILLACAVSLVVRLVRSRGEQRLQLKWFVYASALAATAVAIASFVLPDPSVAFAAFAPLIPIAAGVAIFKYRLYDIDVVINKTVVYGLLAAFITAVYVAIVVGIGAALGRGTSKPNLALSIIATAVVAVAFQPVRERVQKFANRLVYGKRATPYEVLSEFSARVATAAAAEEQLPRMARTLAEGTGASSTTVWLGDGVEVRPAASWPEDGALMSPEESTLSLPVFHQGEQLGAISLLKPPGERLTPAEERLARDLASQAGLVLHNVRLTEELRARVEELRTSRRRLVAAQDAARRKLERNIHDGAQQQLVALSVKTNLARQLAVRDAGKAVSLVAALREEAGRALQELDELAGGLTPTALSELGLVEALGAQAGRAAVPVTVEAPDGLDAPLDVATAVYFCVLEALQNVAKYAGASRAVVRLSRADGRVDFEVDDDGRGFDAAAGSTGTGLRGIADRLAALGGTLDVRSAPGRGTTVLGRVPVREPVSEAAG